MRGTDTPQQLRGVRILRNNYEIATDSDDSTTDSKDSEVRCNIGDGRASGARIFSFFMMENDDYEDDEEGLGLQSSGQGFEKECTSGQVVPGDAHIEARLTTGDDYHVVFNNKDTRSRTRSGSTSRTRTGTRTCKIR
jgi:hypothetical protein